MFSGFRSVTLMFMALVRLAHSRTSTWIKTVRFTLCLVIMHELTAICDDIDAKPKFATLDIVLGTLYITACVLELFGVIAAVMVSKRTRSF